MRTIAQPAKEVKRLQYWVIENLFPRLPIHPSATAYIKAKNILNNSELHVAKPYLLKLDFVDFFPSIKGDDFIQYIRELNNLDLDELDLQLLVRILFWYPKRIHNLQLSVGAPSSPYLSNAIMHRFDSEIESYCCQRSITYTRYADDMTFSMMEKAARSEVLNRVLQVIQQLPFPKLQINQKKTIFGSKAHRRMVTGLVLSNAGRVSLGREKKRRIRAQIHHLITGHLTPQEKSSLRGMLAFARSIEPNFVERMEQKYGKRVLSNI